MIKAATAAAAVVVFITFSPKCSGRPCIDIHRWHTFASPPSLDLCNFSHLRLRHNLVPCHISIYLECMCRRRNEIRCSCNWTISYSRIFLHHSNHRNRCHRHNENVTKCIDFPDRLRCSTSLCIWIRLRDSRVSAFLKNSIFPEWNRRSSNDTIETIKENEYLPQSASSLASRQSGSPSQRNDTETQFPSVHMNSSPVQLPIRNGIWKRKTELILSHRTRRQK